MERVIDTSNILRHLGVSTVPRSLLRLIERALGVARFERICRAADVAETNVDLRRQIDAGLAAASIGHELAGLDAALVPRTGPLIFFSNHPYGFADAMIALRIALALRPDAKVLANDALRAFHFNAEHIIWVDIASTAPSRLSTNRASMRATLRHLRSGGALLIFPSQVCAHLRLPECRVTDPPWSPHLVRLVERTGARCVPLYFEGRNSWLFQLAGLIHPVLRTLLLLREFLALEGRRVRVRIGAVVPRSELAACDSRSEKLRLLRDRVYGLHDAGEARVTVALGRGADA